MNPCLESLYNLDRKMELLTYELKNAQLKIPNFQKHRRIVLEVCRTTREIFAPTVDNPMAREHNRIKLQLLQLLMKITNSYVDNITDTLKRNITEQAKKKKEREVKQWIVPESPPSLPRSRKRSRSSMVIVPETPPSQQRQRLSEQFDSTPCKTIPMGFIRL